MPRASPVQIAGSEATWPKTSRRATTTGPEHGSTLASSVVAEGVAAQDDGWS